MIDTIRLNDASTAAPLLAYFYCARNDAEPERAFPDAIMRSILRQLSYVNLDKPVHPAIIQEYQNRKKEESDDCDPSKLTCEECVELILSISVEDPVILVLDALDECEPSRRHDLMNALEKLIHESASLFKVFVSSRDDTDITLRLRSSPNIYIKSDDNNEDIESFITSEIAKSIDDRKLLYGVVSEQLRQQMIQTLREGAQGMYVLGSS